MKKKSLLSKKIICFTSFTILAFASLVTATTIGVNKYYSTKNNANPTLPMFDISTLQSSDFDLTASPFAYQPDVKTLLRIFKTNVEADITFSGSTSGPTFFINDITLGAATQVGTTTTYTRSVDVKTGSLLYKKTATIELSYIVNPLKPISADVSQIELWHDVDNTDPTNPQPTDYIFPAMPDATEILKRILLVETLDTTTTPSTIVYPNVNTRINQLIAFDIKDTTPTSPTGNGVATLKAISHSNVYDTTTLVVKFKYLVGPKSVASVIGNSNNLTDIYEEDLETKGVFEVLWRKECELNPSAKDLYWLAGIDSHAAADEVNFTFDFAHHYFSSAENQTLQLGGAYTTSQCALFDSSNGKIITTGVTWALDSTTYASISASGLITLSTDPTTITSLKATATYNSNTYDTYIQLLPTAQTIYTTPASSYLIYDKNASAVVPAPATDQISLYDNGTKITSSVTWALDSTTYASIDANGLISLNTNPTTITTLKATATYNSNTYDTYIQLIPLKQKTLTVTAKAASTDFYGSDIIYFNWAKKFDFTDLVKTTDLGYLPADAISDDVVAVAQNVNKIENPSDPVIALDSNWDMLRDNCNITATTLSAGNFKFVLTLKTNADPFFEIGNFANQIIVTCKTDNRTYLPFAITIKDLGDISTYVSNTSVGPTADELVNAIKAIAYGPFDKNQCQTINPINDATTKTGTATITARDISTLYRGTVDILYHWT